MIKLLPHWPCFAMGRGCIKSQHKSTPACPDFRQARERISMNSVYEIHTYVHINDVYVKLGFYFIHTMLILPWLQFLAIVPATFRALTISLSSAGDDLLLPIGALSLPYGDPPLYCLTEIHTHLSLSTVLYRESDILLSRVVAINGLMTRVSFSLVSHFIGLTLNEWKWSFLF